MELGEEAHGAFVGAAGMGGKTPKFTCRTADGRSIRVKYFDGDRLTGNREVFAEGAASLRYENIGGAPAGNARLMQEIGELMRPVFTELGVPAAAHVMNAVILTAVLSALKGIAGTEFLPAPVATLEQIERAHEVAYWKALVEQELQQNPVLEEMPAVEVEREERKEREYRERHRS